MFSKRLKELRIESELSQEKLADIIKISRNSISKYEASGSEPSFDVLVRISDYFNVSLDYLLGRTCIRTPPYIIKEIKSISDTNNLNNIIAIIKNSSHNIEFIYQLLKFMEYNKKI